MRYETMIGLRYLRAKRKQTFVSVITLIAVAGVSVGVAALIIVLSGMEGVQDYMRDKILGFNAHIIISRMGGIENPEEILKKLETVPHVTGASPFIEGQVLMRGSHRSEGVLVRGIDLDTVEQVMTVGECIKYGSLSELDPNSPGPGGDLDALPAIALGEDLAFMLGAYQGSEISVIVPQGIITPLGMRPRVKRFRVGAIYKFGFYEVDSSIALVHIETANQLFNKDGKADGIVVETDDVFKVINAKKEIRKVINAPFSVTTWIDSQKQLFAALKMEQMLSGLVLSLIMLVAAFNIVSMLLMLVMEKYRDIAILKSMGATDGGIMRIFIIQGTIIGTFGTIAGVVLGLVVCYIQIRWKILQFDPSIYQFSDVPMKVTLLNVFGVSIGAMFISFLTTIYPSWQASRIKPAESLRYE